MKKLFWGMLSGGVLLVVAAFLVGRFVFPANELASLPLPELSEGERGELGIDRNINEATIDQYLGRADAVYRDMRMLKDPGNYEAIGGDAYLSGFVKGFEVVPFPYLVNVEGLPEAVGETYTGETLFTNKDGKYVANYEESLEILETLFPKDKVIFLMCGGGGYSGMMKNMLVALGWDETKIYDVGGYWFYEGENNVNVKRVTAEGETVYDFYKVPYHEIDFTTLKEKYRCVDCGDKLVDLDIEEYVKLVKAEKSFLVMIDQGGCTTAERLKGFALKYAKEAEVKIYRMTFSDMKKTDLYSEIKYYPSFAIVEKGELKAWLRADSDEDAAVYNDYNAFYEWVEKYL